MASETFDEQSLPGHKIGDLATESYLATKVITMVKSFNDFLLIFQYSGANREPFFLNSQLGI